MTILGWTSIPDAASMLDVSGNTVGTLCGQLADDPTLYDPERGISAAGMELLAEQVASEGSTRSEQIAEVRAVTSALHEATHAAEEATEKWRAAIRQAIKLGARAVEVAEAAEISRERVYQIRDDRR